MENKTDPPRIVSVSQHVAANVRQLRAKRRWSLAQLSERLHASGYPMSLKMLSKLETGERGISVDDAHALALVLDVTPEMLMMPSSMSEQKELAAAFEHWRRVWSEGMQRRSAVLDQTERAERDALERLRHVMGDDPAHQETVRALIEQMWGGVADDPDLARFPDATFRKIIGIEDEN